MKNHRIFTILMALFLAIGLAACERNAATPMPGSSDSESTQGAFDILGEQATKTAAAQAESEAALSGEETEATEAPKPSPTPEPESEEPAPEPTTKPAAVKNEYPVPDTYTLLPGEFPYCIARRFDIAPSTLLNANNLSSASITYPGNTLTIPKNAAAFNAGARSLRQHPTTYTIQAGDTVQSIACLFGDVYPQAIKDANGLKNAYTLNVGQTIQIP
ncbi:MAG: LysM peptidoglycan-binding domain-containing protein [Chloroflexota bacterium]|nr:LysM peptidoglycan-binding domain-containing protein [Chloroflexota bacterium]